MTHPIFIQRDGHRTWLKWHRARRRAADPVFTGARILEAMRLGASVEVDLVLHGGGGFAVLHNFTLDGETTGTGRVREALPDALRQLHLRGNDGTPIADRVMLLEDLCASLATGEVHEDALLQLDFKEDESVLDAAVIAGFAAATAPIARNVIVSSGSARAVAMLTAAVPGMQSGFDPSDEAVFRAALAAGRLQDFVDEAIAAAPKASVIYLHWQMVTLAAEAGFDMVEAFHGKGRRVDAWTIETGSAEGLAAAERLLALKVDQITTDDAEVLHAELGAR